MCLTELELPNQHAQFFLPRTLRQSVSCVLIPLPCVLPGSRVEFCQWLRSGSLLSSVLDVSVRTFRPKAPQNPSPRHIHTLTTFWVLPAVFCRLTLREHLKSHLYLVKQGFAACVQSEHTPTDTAPVPVHFRFLFETPLHHTVQVPVSQRVVHRAFAARPGL